MMESFSMDRDQETKRVTRLSCRWLTPFQNQTRTQPEVALVVGLHEGVEHRLVALLDVSGNGRSPRSPAPARFPTCTSSPSASSRTLRKPYTCGESMLCAADQHDHARCTCSLGRVHLDHRARRQAIKLLRQATPAVEMPLAQAGHRAQVIKRQSARGEGLGSAAIGGGDHRLCARCGQLGQLGACRSLTSRQPKKKLRRCRRISRLPPGARARPG